MTFDPEFSPRVTRDGKEYHFFSKQCLDQLGSATSAGKRGDPCTIVIFGVLGDLIRRKLLPALYKRFSSRGVADFQDKLLSAMRFEFGGHHEKKTVK